MGEATGIAWCDSTRNFWSGCSKVGPGCDHCYAEAFSRFSRGKNEATGEATNWGHGAPRIPHLKGADRDLRKWDGSKLFNKTHQRRRRVFINSHSDFFDNEVPEWWRQLAWTTMSDCENLIFLVLTKRIGNVPEMLPKDWGNGYENVWLGATVVNQEEVDRDIPKLDLFRSRVRWLSIEPQLEPIDLGPWLDRGATADNGRREFEPFVDWVITGGESGPHARPYDMNWARRLIRQCKESNVPCFVKQLGAKPYEADSAFIWQLEDAKGGDPAEWPDDLQVQEFPA